MVIRPVAKKRQSAPPVRRRSVGELLGWMRGKSGQHLARTYLGALPRSPPGGKAKSRLGKPQKKP